MRELHEGIELLEEERDAGPFMWRNWDSWVERCEEIISWIDERMIAGKRGPAAAGADARRKHGLVCGVEWPIFRKAVEQYRKWLEKQYGGSQGIKDKLVFAHNDVGFDQAGVGSKADSCRHNTGIFYVYNLAESLLCCIRQMSISS